MYWSGDIDWAGLFGLSVHPLELVVRGTAIYLFLLIVFRLAFRRDVGAIGIADVLLLVLIADAAQNAMSGEYRSITDGFVLVCTIIACNLSVDGLAYRWPALRRLLQRRELVLVRDGRILHRNLRRELMTDEDLMSVLRQHGVADIHEVRAACIESDGEVSVILRRRPMSEVGSAPRRD